MTKRVAVVTGALGGIGQGIVTELLRREFRVVCCDRLFNPRTFPEGPNVGFVAGDIANVEDHTRFVNDVFDVFGRVDCLVNNAGVSVLSRGDLLDITLQSYDRNFDVNTRGTFFLTQAICRRMIETAGQESARSVIFISSSNAALASPDRAEYAMSKSAVAMMAKLYALRLAPHGIAVYEVRPGLIRTPMTEVARERYDARIAEGFTPFNRWGTPHDVGRGVASLASGDLPFMTGSVVEIDGGMHIHQYQA